MKNSILEAIGDTPIVRLNAIGADVESELFVKVEYMNPGLSVKDRIARRIVEDAERRGALAPGGTIVEATSGNTGAGLALVAAVKGYKCVFVMPDKMSQEKRDRLRAYGARVIVTPTVALDDPESHYCVARRIVEETPNAILANQYNNPNNPESHYRMTGPEIWRQTGGDFDAFVAGLGTGGTISGIGRFLKEKNPAVKIIGVDPIGSILYGLFHGERAPKAESYRTEGIGESFKPETLSFENIDEIVRVADGESLRMARRLAREEGVLAGGSAGGAVMGTLRYARSLAKPERVVTLLPDSGMFYLSKVFSDEWMAANGFLEEAGEAAAAPAAPAKAE